MKFKNPTFVAAATLFAVLVIPVCLAAQDRSEEKHRHHHYKLIDMATLGGPQSIIYEQGTRSLNNHGTFTGCADRRNLDLNKPQNPYFLYPDNVLDPYIQHVFEWEEGKKIDIGALVGGTSSCTQWINESGWIVGGSTNGLIDPLADYAEVNAVLWKHGRIHNLGTFGGNQSLAWSVNDEGQVVGFALNAAPDSFAGSVFAFGATQARAFLWQNGHKEDLGTLGGPDSDALLVNDHGQIAGMSQTDAVINATTQQPTVHPFFWENGRMIDVKTLGGAFGYPNALNNHGQVVGSSNLLGDSFAHAFRWQQGVLKDLGTLGGNNSEARSINEEGEAAGWATFPGEQVVHATVWKEDKIVDLGVLPGSPCSYANGIDALGQVLGAVQQCPNQGPRVAFLWEDGEMVDLNSLILPGSDLFLIGAINGNDRGEIAVEGTLPNGEMHAALLIPCDENHADLQGCDPTLVDIPESQVSKRMIQSISVPTNNGDLPSGLGDRLRNRMGRRDGIFDVGSPKR